VVFGSIGDIGNFFVQFTTSNEGELAAQKAETAKREAEIASKTAEIAAKDAEIKALKEGAEKDYAGDSWGFNCVFPSLFIFSC
jgi:hypothetical protein